MKVLFVLALVSLMTGCGTGTLPFQAAPTPHPTLTAVDVYLNETDDHMESMFVYNDDLNQALMAEQKDPTLYADAQWRQSVTKALHGLRDEYQFLQNFPPVDGAEQYSTAVLGAEAHTDKAAALLLTWLDKQDDTTYRQAMQEFDAAKTARVGVNQLLDTLLKK